MEKEKEHEWQEILQVAAVVGIEAVSQSGATTAAVATKAEEKQRTVIEVVVAAIAKASPQLANRVRVEELLTGVC